MSPSSQSGSRTFLLFALVRPTLLLHQTLLLIRILALLTPARSFIVSRFLQLVTLLLRLVHSIRLVLSRRVYCHQLQRRLARVPELMLRPCWHYDNVVGRNLLFATCYIGFTFARCEDAVRADVSTSN